MRRLIEAALACWTMFSFNVEPIYKEAGGFREDTMMGIDHEPDRELKIASTLFFINTVHPPWFRLSHQCNEQYDGQ